MKRRICPICGRRVKGRVYASTLYSGRHEYGELEADGWKRHKDGKGHQEALKSLSPKEKGERNKMLAKKGWGGHEPPKSQRGSR